MYKTPLKIEGAVPAKPLIAILHKLTEDKLDVSVLKSQLLIKAGNKRSGIRMDQEVLLPIEAVDTPKKWKPLPDNFSDAIAIVQPCAGSNESQFVMTCVHLTPKWVEACDNHQVSRFKIRTDISDSVLIRKESIKHIISLDMSEVSETKHWIHFRNADGLVLSCRHWVDDYPSKDISKVLKVDGDPLTLPKGLKEAAEKAEVFSSENTDDSHLVVSLKKGKFKITGRGTSGWFTEVKESKYTGQSFQFTIPPKLLVKLVQQHNDCLVSEGRLKVKGGKFVYVTVLGKVV
jgi:hypothetical protein